jgi:hypothetical protein
MTSIGQSIEALCSEQGLDRNLIIEAMKEAVRAAARKQFKAALSVKIFPPSVLMLTFSLALKTVTRPLAKSPLMLFSLKDKDKVVFGASSILPIFPKLMTALAFSGVTIVLDEKTERPLCAASLLILTKGVCPLTLFPLTKSSPAILSEFAKVTIEYVAIKATTKHIESALRIHS